MPSIRKKISRDEDDGISSAQIIPRARHSQEEDQEDEDHQRAEAYRVARASNIRGGRDKEAGIRRISHHLHRRDVRHAHYHSDARIQLEE